MQKRTVIERLTFSCPICRCVLAITENSLNCDSCREIYSITDEGKFVFSGLEMESIEDPLDRLKNRAKKFTRTYRLMINLVSPVYPTRDLIKFLKSQKLESSSTINLGSGSSNIDDRIVNFDIFEYESVDVICSIEALPLADNSVDTILNIAVLEHVPNPNKVVAEFNRVLRPGGKAFCFIPFIQGFHASPWDYQRYTSSGIRELFKEFDVIDVKPIGPTSGLLWIFQEWLAIVFSFGIKRLHLFLWLFLLVTTWPIKYLDFFFKTNQLSENIASGFVVIVRKRESF